MPENRKEPTFNRDIFLKNFQGIEDLALESIDNFLLTLPTLLVAIDSSLKTKNGKDLELSAHSLKGSLSHFYAEPSKLLAWKLEQLGRGAPDDRAGKIFTDLQAEIAMLSIALRSLADELRNYDK